jgi:hypothetical protein
VARSKDSKEHAKGHAGKDKAVSPIREARAAGPRDETDDERSLDLSECDGVFWIDVAELTQARPAPATGMQAPTETPASSGAVPPNLRREFRSPQPGWDLTFKIEHPAKP